VVPDESQQPFEHVAQLQQQLMDQDTVAFDRRSHTLNSKELCGSGLSDATPAMVFLPVSVPLRVGGWVLGVLPAPGRPSALQDHLRGPYVVVRIRFCGDEKDCYCVYGRCGVRESPVMFKRHISDLTHYYV
jgi:hypothetical protein